MTAPPAIPALPALDALARHSVRVIEEGQAPTGAYAASPTFPVYRYCWFRDGAFIADAMSRAGRTASADAFFEWCSRVLLARAESIERLIERRRLGEAIAPEELLHCRYTLDGEEAPEQWWNFQLDGYGTWLWALKEHARRHVLDVSPYTEAVELCVRYLMAFWDVPSYDWWEENIGHQHTSTLAALYGGLRAASSVLHADGAAASIREEVLARGVRDGRLVKWLDGDDVDASLIACATPFRLLQPGDPIMQRTVAALEEELAHGGVHRYAGDTYYGGGEWPLLAGFLGWYYHETGRRDDAWAQLEWIAAQATSDGYLPEQVDGHVLAPGRRQEWLARWGPIATPLLWSHAMFLTLALELGAVSAPVPAPE